MPDYYGTVSGFRSYHTARGRSVAAFDDDAEIAAALLLSSEWADGKYRTAFPGTKVGERAQVREWPRYNAFDIYGYLIGYSASPVEIENAVYEACYREMISPGVLNVDWTPNKYKRVAVDGAVNVEFAMFGNAAEIQTQFVAIDQILSPILTAVGGDHSALSGRTART